MTSKIELQDRWIAALRSGEYGQTSKQLRHGNNYCCLGVACTIYDPFAWREDVFLNNAYYLPEIVSNAYGLNEMDPIIGLSDEEAIAVGLPPDGTISLSDLNDRHGWSFERIANFVELYRERVFPNG